ncbi:MAG: TIGR03905 family TSCPD domain-containing protein [Paludibacteraceae bacterium]|nr:TIGR03905 family TSCPD domain-containing protein [Paludibacteraceae bacterium]
MEQNRVYQCVGTCSKYINISVEDGIIKNVQFLGGCHGNTQGVAILVKGMKVEDAISKLKGIDCGGRGTSCPDQLAHALEAFL